MAAPVLLTVEDYRKKAAGLLPGLARDYYNGGAEEEETLRRNETAYSDFLIRPRVLRDVSSIDTSSTWLGANVSFPIGIAPTAFHKLATNDGELATVRGAARSGSIMIASSWSTISMEEIAAESGKLNGRMWFQLYVYKDRITTEKLIARAEAAGFEALVLTVDTPVPGRRLKDTRNGFTLPAPLGLANFNDPSRSVIPSVEEGESGFTAYVTDQIDSSLSWNTLEWIKKRTSLPVIVKGILRADDAQEAVRRGVSAIIVSNHGGRQLDSAPATIECLPEVVQAVSGKCAVYLDGGIRNGRDIFKAIALGAEGVFVGRPVLWALAVDEEKGVHDIMTLLQAEFKHTMQLAGCRSIAEMKSSDQLVVKKSYYVSKI